MVLTCVNSCCLCVDVLYPFFLFGSIYHDFVLWTHLSNFLCLCILWLTGKVCIFVFYLNLVSHFSNPYSCIVEQFCYDLILDIKPCLNYKSSLYLVELIFLYVLLCAHLCWSPWGVFCRYMLLLSLWQIYVCVCVRWNLWVVFLCSIFSTNVFLFCLLCMRWDEYHFENLTNENFLLDAVLVDADDSRIDLLLFDVREKDIMSWLHLAGKSWL